MATARLVPALVDDLVEEILLRVPPDDPAGLVRAALACKGWRRLVSSTGFRRRFRDFHRAAPVLGFLNSQRAPFCFESASSFRPRDGSGVQIQRALDARHGRVLLSRYLPGSTRKSEEDLVVPGYTRESEEDLVVWDPIRGDLLTLPRLRHRCCDGWTAALVCAAAECDHLDCAGGHFSVVFVGINDAWRLATSACVYSSEAGAWSEHCDLALITTTTIPAWDPTTNLGPSALVGNTLLFRCSTGILEHDLDKQEFDVIEAPAFFMQDHSAVLMTTEDGNLGLAVIQQSKLVLWSREGQPQLDSRKENIGWAQSKVIELGVSLPVNVLLGSARLAGFADGIAVILVRTVGRLFAIDLKSSRVREIGKGLNLHGYHVIPFVSFCIPALEAASSGAGPSVNASMASQSY